MTHAPTIAIVDDEATSRFTIRKLLERRGYAVEDFSEAASFLERHTSQRFSLVLLDIDLGASTSGLDVCKTLRKLHGINELPILMVTAHADDKVFVESLEAGANDFISKPIQPAKLIARVQTQLRIAKACSDLVAAQIEIAARQRLEALGLFAMGLAHNLNNTLGIIHGSAEMLKRAAVDHPKQQKFAGLILDAAKRSAGLLSHLSVLGKNAAAEPTCDAVHVCQATTNLIRSLVPDRIAVDIRAEVAHVVAALPAPDLATVLTHLVKHGADSIPGKGDVWISVGTQRSGWVQILVHDSAPPLEEGSRERIFEPFYGFPVGSAVPAPGSRENLGLSLWSAWQIVHNAGGELRVTESNRHGTTYEIVLPQGSRTPSANCAI